jgi:7,8-dihydropterin-6-yl-methyl-4-(beta-D-ribofuranosyl)aminobenzene 5'-phosphate synthase
MTITSLVDDYCPKRGFTGEHGLSLYVEAGGAKLLFDTGQSGVFIRNASNLGIDLASLDAVVLSHGHYDHGGGLPALMDRGHGAIPLYAGSCFTDKRYSKLGDGLREIGLESVIGSLAKADMHVIEAQREIASGVFVLPKAERLDGCAASPRFKRLCDGDEVVDRFDDELSLVVPEDEGIVVITGCAHRGIVNIARAAMKAFPGKPLKALVGGLHLVEASPHILTETARAIADLDPEAVYCSHCTGLSGFSALLQFMPGKVTWLSCGMHLAI